MVQDELLRGRTPEDEGSLAAWVRAAGDVSDVVASARGLAEAAPGLLRGLADALSCDRAVLWVPEVSRGGLERRWAWQRDARPPGPRDGGEPRAGDAEPDLASRAWSLRRPVWTHEVGGASAAGGLAFPILYGDAVHGVVELSSRTAVPSGETSRAFAVVLGKQIGQFVAREGALREFARSRRELSDLFENAPVGIHLMDREGRILRANRALLDLLGLARDEFVGRLWRDLHADPRVADELLARLAACDRGGDVIDVEARLRRKDGEERRVHVNANVLRDESGFVHVRAFTRDVTRAREAEAALRASEDRYRRLVEGARDYAIHALDPAGRVVGWNSGAQRLYGYAEADVLGQDFARSFTPADREDDVPARMLRLAADEGEFRHEGWRVRKDGSRFWAEVSYTALRDGTGRVEGISQLTRDVTERRWLDDLRRKGADLESENRAVLEAARRSAEIVRSLAQAVDGPAGEVEAAAGRLEARARERGSPGDAQELQDAVAGLRRAIQRLDEHSVPPGTAGRGTPVAVDVARLAGEARDMLREAAAERRVRVDVDVEPGLTGVVADPIRLGQVLYNLLSNAIRSSRARGRVAMRVLGEGRDLFRVEVEDSGLGIPPDAVGDVFAERPPGDPGEERDHGALLPATRRVAEQQGGRVGVRSLLGRGSVLFAVLPRVPPVALDATRASGQVAGGPVLVLSEDPATRASVCWTLGNAGQETVPASGAQEALDACRDRRFDALAVDLRLAGMSAVDFVDRVRSGGSCRGVPCVVGVLGTPESGAAGLVASDLLPRPAPADRLFAALERARVRRGRRARVVGVDGDDAILSAVGRTLEVLGYRALVEPDGNAALRACAEDPPEAVLLSPFLRGIDPFSFLLHLRQLPGLALVPVFLTVPRLLEGTPYEALGPAADAAARERAWARAFRHLSAVAPDARARSGADAE